jgi:hypothetical protein
MDEQEGAPYVPEAPIGRDEGCRIPVHGAKHPLRTDGCEYGCGVTSQTHRSIEDPMPVRRSQQRQHFRKQDRVMVSPDVDAIVVGGHGL